MTLVPLGPAALVESGRSFWRWVGEVVDVGAGLPARVTGLLDEVTRLLGVLEETARRAAVLVDRIEGVAGQAELVVGSAKEITTGATEVVTSAREITTGAAEVVTSAREITGGAAEVVTSAREITTGAAEVVTSAREITGGAQGVVEVAEAASTRVQKMLDLYEPLLQRLAPMARRFVDDLEPHEVEAAVKLVDQLPEFTNHMITDIMPILSTLDRVGPDLRELLDVTKDVRHAIDGVPGLHFFKRRGEAKHGEDPTRSTPQQ